MDRERGRPTEKPKGYLGKKLYGRRVDLKLTQPEMAKHIGMSRRQYQRLEKGFMPAAMKSLVRMGTRLNLRLEDFRG